MKEELLKIVQESLSSDDASEIVKEKFKKALEAQSKMLFVGEMQSMPLRKR